MGKPLLLAKVLPFFKFVFLSFQCKIFCNNPLLFLFAGKRFVKPSKVTKEMDADREVSKFINQCNEIKAATLATKDGGQLGIIKPPLEQPSGAK
ncbi:hypothetical protein VIGAN_06261600 [Vigna angularis var. angularis]|uniref:Uncharacterized protein n=1 Tax=Vigna angularis var. angularis TaxID=157739 RepID=A0A0S3SEN5_PHAAN|nr:hypothetical protein VIGAN_06261600 [Vigna angularis var. angularis]